MFPWQKVCIILTWLTAHNNIIRAVLPSHSSRRENRHRGLGRAVVGVLDLHRVVARDRLPVGMVRIRAGRVDRGDGHVVEYAVGVGCRPVIDGVGIVCRTAGSRHRESPVAAAEAGHVRVRTRGLRERQRRIHRHRERLDGIA